MQHETYTETVDKSATSAADLKKWFKWNSKKLKGDSNDTVTFDGTLQKRGHASASDAVTEISTLNWKCLDTYVMSKISFGWKLWKSKKNSSDYNDWKTNHVCQVNLFGSWGQARRNRGAEELQPPRFFLTAIFDELKKIVLKWKIVQSYKTSWNSSKFIDIYNIIIDLDTRDGILSVMNSDRFSLF